MGSAKGELSIARLERVLMGVTGSIETDHKRQDVHATEPQLVQPCPTTKRNPKKATTLTQAKSCRFRSSAARSTKNSLDKTHETRTTQETMSLMTTNSRTTLTQKPRHLESWSTDDGAVFALWKSARRPMSWRRHLRQRSSQARSLHCARARPAPGGHIVKGPQTKQKTSLTFGNQPCTPVVTWRPYTKSPSSDRFTSARLSPSLNTSKGCGQRSNFRCPSKSNNALSIGWLIACGVCGAYGVHLYALDGRKKPSRPPNETAAAKLSSVPQQGAVPKQEMKLARL
jgi:hypothetical protein